MFRMDRMVLFSREINEKIMTLRIQNLICILFLHCLLLLHISMKHILFPQMAGMAMYA